MTSFVTKKLGRKRSLGSLLKAARSKANLSLEEVESSTRIHLKYLQALETGRYEALPAEAYNIGFVRTYAKFLKLNPEKIVSLYREERSHKHFYPDAQAVNLAPKRVGDWQFLITPKFLGIVGTALLFGSVALYIGVQLHQFSQPPSLVITNVPSEFTSTKDTVKLVGSTNEGAAVTINTEPIFVATDGTFTQTVQLSPGVNEITVQARNRVEKEARRTVKVLFNPDLASASGSTTTE